MDKIENPAAKLLVIVEALRKQSGDLTTLQAVAAVFEIEPSHAITVSRKLIEIADLCQIAKLATKKHIFGNTEIYLAPFITFEAFILNINLASLWKHYASKLNATLMTELTFADHFLENAIGSASSEKSLAAIDLISRLDQLLEDCLQSDLAPEIQDLFARYLQKLRSALIDYRIYGDDALQKILDETVGSIHRHSTEIKTQSDKAKQFVSYVFDAIGKMNDLVSSPESVKALSATAVYFLPILS